MRRYERRETEALRVPIVLIMPLTFGITSALRALHNGSYDRRYLDAYLGEKGTEKPTST